jgi:hypothetical protein
MTPSIVAARGWSPFSVFVVLYVSAFLLEMVEHWTYPAVTLAFVVLSTVLLLRITRQRLFWIALTSTIYFAAFRFPEVANHVNLILFTNVAIILATVWSWLPSSRVRDDDAFFEMLQPLMRLSIIITFSVAGFHKLNTDFIDPAVSCTTGFSRTMWQTFWGEFLGLGVPTALAVGLVFAAAVLVLARERRRDFAWPRVDWHAVAAPFVAIATLATVLLVIVTGTEPVTSPRNAVLFLVAVFVLSWQLVEGPLLLVPRLQWVALCLSLLVHAQLAMIKIIDFQAIAVALLATFVPAEVWTAWLKAAPLGLGGLRLHRIQVYFGVNVLLGGALMWLHNHGGAPVPEPYALTGLLFNLTVLVLIWPLLSDLFSRKREWRWRGTPVFHSLTPKLLYLVPVALVLFGLTSHFGLRTAGNFSMFSNLRTEGETSNHLLFGSNPLKFAGYQEDVVLIHEIDDDLARIGHQYRPLDDRALPVVEFRKLLLLWREAGRAVPIVLEHEGRVVRSDDIASEPEWRVDSWDWEMRLMDFRQVQPEGPNTCRW